jgi:glycerol-3-phosphate acyltransferase PlsY
MIRGALFLSGAYLLGSIPFAFLVPRYLGGVDVRRAGSGNVGATNVWRTTRLSLALLVLLLDAGKGALAVLAVRLLGAPSGLQVVAGLCAIAGHMYPVWLGFQGGKGVATTGGVFAVIAPLATLGATAVFLAVAWASRYASVASMSAAVALPAGAWLLPGVREATLAASVAAVLVLWRHRDNMVRLRSGAEPRIGARTRETR